MVVAPTALYKLTRTHPRSWSNERLPFVLPEFNRQSWVSESARSVWEPRIARIQRAWLDLEWISVAEDKRKCALLWITPELLSELIGEWEAAELSALQLQVGESYFGGNATQVPVSASGMLCIAVGTANNVERFRRAWVGSDHDAIGELLGYPECCRIFFHDVWIQRQSIDTTWAMAENTSSGQIEGKVRIRLPEGMPPLANILWRWLGVRAVPHLPCRFDCPASIEHGKRMLEIARHAGYAEEADWIAEILAWPVEWSALHGIAEVKSPLMKLSTQTDATAGKWTVQWAGTRYPGEGAVGLHFPFVQPKKAKPESSSDLRKLTQNSPPDSNPAWLYIDNGFTSAAAMRDLHEPIVKLAHGALLSERGKVLDLGCGNGALLQKICAGRHGLVPCGVDSKKVALDHARQLLPQFAGNFVEGDIFDIDLALGRTRRYALVLLMLGRLQEVPPENALALLRRLQRLTTRVLAYVYPDRDSQPLDRIARQMGLELEESDFKTVGFLK